MSFTRYVLSWTAACVGIFGAVARLAGRIGNGSLIFLGAAILLLMWMAHRAGRADD